MTIHTLTRSIDVPTPGHLFRFRTDSYEVQRAQVEHAGFQVCITLERLTTTDEVTVWFEVSDVSCVRSEKRAARRSCLDALKTLFGEAELMPSPHGVLTGVMPESEFRDLTHKLAHALTHHE